MEHKAVIKKWDFPIFLHCCLNKQGIEGLFGMASSRCSIFKTVSFQSKSTFKRYVWTKDMSQKSDHFWKNVLFSGETMIELFPKRRNFVRLPKQSRSLQKYVGQHAKFCRKKTVVKSAYICFACNTSVAAKSTVLYFVKISS